MTKADPKEVLRKLILFTDRVLPEVPAVAQPTLLHLFARTVAVGSEICSLSYQDLVYLTGQAPITIKRVLRSLQDKGFITLVSGHGGRKAKGYRFVWPEDEIAGVKPHKLHRDVDTLMRSLLSPETTAEYLVDRLDESDRDRLQLIINRMAPAEKEQFMSRARIDAGDHADVEKQFRELVALRKFGYVTLQRYQNLFNRESGSPDGIPETAS